METELDTTRHNSDTAAISLTIGLKPKAPQEATRVLTELMNETIQPCTCSCRCLSSLANQSFSLYFL